jgi:hypothetical protein
MATQLPVPERGQPLDVTYIYQIVQSLNDLHKQLGDTKRGYVAIGDGGAPQLVQTNQSAIVAGFDLVSTSSLQSAGSSLPWDYTFDKEFKYPPIVTATAFNKGTSDAGKDVTVTINSITTSKVEGSVKFNLGGETTMGINVIAVGIPNS